MLQRDMGAIAGIRPEDMDFFNAAAKRCSQGFCQKALAVISRANMLVVRNVNQKMVFTNMVDRLFVI